MSELPEQVTIDQQAQVAGRVRADVDGSDPITALREHCLRFIEGANLPQHQRMMAIPKMDEMIFWIRSGIGRG